MSRLVVAAVAGIGLSLGVVGTAAASASAASVSSAGSDVTIQLWFPYNYYETEAECNHAGQYLVSTGQYKAYVCERATVYPEFHPWRLKVLE